MNYLRKKYQLHKPPGQAIIEYIILYTAIIAVLIIFLSGKNSFFAQSYNGSLKRSANSIVVGVNKILE